MRKLLTRTTLVFLLVVLPGTWYMLRSVASFDQYIYTSTAQLPAAYTGIVPGAKVYGDGSLSPMLEDRVIQAARLYNAGKIQKILLTGDHGREKYDEVNAMRKYLRRMSVPESDIFLDHAGFTTYDSLYRARKLGLNAYGFAADRREYTASSHNWSKF